MVSKIEELCILKNIKMTDQRKVIANILSNAIDHPDVEELYKRASSIDSKISLPTVYRTVRLLEEMGIIEKLEFKDGRARYENISGHHHHHLIDVKTGKVIEFHNLELEILKEKIAKELGYELIDHKLELYGVPLRNVKE